MSVITNRIFRLLPERYDREYEGVTIEAIEFITLDVAPANLKEVETLSGYVLGAANPTNAQSILDDFSIEATTPTQYVFSLSYVPKQSSKSNESGGAPQIHVQFGTWYTDRVVEFDTVSGNPIANAVGDAPNPLPVIKIPNDEIIFTRRQTTVDLTRNASKGRINDTAFTLVGVSIPQYCGMLSDYSFQVVYDDDGNVEYDVTYAFKTSQKKNNAGSVIGFKVEIANTGFNFYKVASTPPAIPYRNDDNTIPVSSKDLKLDGTVNNGARVYNEFVIHDTEDFSTWGLPTAWPY